VPQSPGEGLEVCSNSQTLSDLLLMPTFLLDVVVSAVVIDGFSSDEGRTGRGHRVEPIGHPGPIGQIRQRAAPSYPIHLEKCCN